MSDGGTGLGASSGWAEALPEGEAPVMDAKQVTGRVLFGDEDSDDFVVRPPNYHARTKQLIVVVELPSSYR